jgi:HAE1 family hydrophobic/amphiphilic exporter-1
MIRTEIYANRSVEEDIAEELEKRIPDISYSLIEDVKGRGRSGVRHGTVIWPELSILYILYGNEIDALLIHEAVKDVKKAFPREGIKIFQYEVNVLAEK